YLANLPSPTPENLRWFMPADGWDLYEGYIFKGKAFRIAEKIGDEKFRGKAFGLKMYDNPSLEGKYYVVGSGQILDKVYGQNICSSVGKTSNDFNLGQLLICQSSCRNLSDNEKKEKLDSLKPFPVSGYAFYEQTLARKLYENCPISLDSFSSYYLSDGPENESLYEVLKQRGGQAGDYYHNYYFITPSTDFDKGYVKLVVGDKKFYLDVRVCKERPEHCKFIDRDLSWFEKDWISLQRHKEKKDITILNILINELKPCVKKKDLECIKKYFADPVRHEFLAEWYHGYKFPEVSLEKDFLKELDACLNYEQLLPHLMGTRGVNKVCKFMYRADSSLGGDEKKKQDERSNLLIIGIDYPESVRVGSTYDSIYSMPRN
ncbi:MAG: hypothetical protein WDA09_03380, partial [Bacteriovoracaceae bacterium]